MQITDLNIKSLNIPFKVSFKHSSAERSATQSIWVEARSSDGVIGFGEGCPREYVTNESLDSAFLFFNTHKDSISTQIQNLAGLKQWIEDYKREIDANPAAWCAIELALLDLIAKDNKKTVESLLNLPPLINPFQYTAILGDSSFEIFSKQLARYLTLGFTDFKVKISGNVDQDNEKLQLFLGNDHIRLRLDANNHWKNSSDVIEYLQNLKVPVFAIEEPLLASDYEGMNKILKAFPIKIILDESFVKVEDFNNIPHPFSNWIINLRISKMGGILRSIKIIDNAKKLGIATIIGAQVGETSLLTRATLTLANYSEDILLAQEGAFGTLLLEKDVCEPPLMFKEKGLLNFYPSGDYGFQLNLD